MMSFLSSMGILLTLCLRGLEWVWVGLLRKGFFAEFDGTKISAQIDSLCLLDDGTLQDWKFTSVYGFKKDSKPKWEHVAQMNVQLELLRANGLDAKRLQIVGVLRDWRPNEAKKDKKYPNKVAIHEIEVKPREHTQSFIKARIQAHRDAESVLPECSSHEHWDWRRCSGYCPVSKFCQQWIDKQKEI
jgi:hypothetical protein